MPSSEKFLGMTKVQFAYLAILAWILAMSFSVASLGLTLSVSQRESDRDKALAVQTHASICALRQDLVHRVKTEQFLLDHAQNPTDAESKFLKTLIASQKTTVAALDGVLVCT